MRAVVSALALGVLAACSPAVPDSGAGIGFDTDLTSSQARLARDTALTTGQPLAPPSAISDEGTTLLSGAIGDPVPLPAAAQPLAAPTLQAAPTVVASGISSGSDDIAAETAAALAAASANSGQVPLQASPANPAPRVQGNPGISDENDFSAVAGRESIASDAERLAQNRAQYQVIAPTVLPTRSGTAQPNVVAYALQSTNPRGTRIYSRAGLNKSAKAARNCARFGSPDQAQAAFLSKGGPQKDRQGLDPDGDGYACGWDPSSFRQAINN